MGNIFLLKEKNTIGIVGSRECTEYGRKVSYHFSKELSVEGLCVVSGMALGIDKMAHQAAIEHKGKTIAVLGCGADEVYPPENAELYEKIKNNGAVISEFKLGARADRQTFPIRNRIVSGLGLATVVVESDVRGGSMITARLAAEQGRDVFAVPGRIDSRASRGCNLLIREGATLAMSADDIIDELRSAGQIEFAFSPSENAPVQESGDSRIKAKIALSQDEEAVVKAMSGPDVSYADEISERSGFPIQKCLALLTMLEIRKVVKKADGGWVL